MCVRRPRWADVSDSDEEAAPTAEEAAAAPVVFGFVAPAEEAAPLGATTERAKIQAAIDSCAVANVTPAPSTSGWCAACITVLDRGTNQRLIAPAVDMELHAVKMVPVPGQHTVKAL